MKGRTSLEWAAAFGYVPMVHHLLARGATPTAKALSEARAGAERSSKSEESSESSEPSERYALVVDALRAAGIES